MTALEVRDNGSGIPLAALPGAFGSIGESPKLKRRQTPEGRTVHGSEGRGRFKALALGEKAKWITTYSDKDQLLTYDVTINRGSQTAYTYTDPIKSNANSTGTILRVEDIDNGQDSLIAPEVHDELVGRFAIYLKNYPDCVLKYENTRIDPNSVISKSQTIQLSAPETNAPLANLEIIEWTFEVESKRLYICDEHGFTWYEMLMGVQLPGLSAAAYVKWSAAKEYHDSGRFSVGELDEDLRIVVEQSKNELRQYRQRRLAEEAQTVVEEWKREHIYPFPDDAPTTVIERAKRQVFDIVATRVHEFHEPLRSGEKSGKQLTLELVKQALESNPTSLQRILERTLHLPKVKQDELAELLEFTSFEAIIEAAKTVAQRLDVIYGFESLIFDKDWKKRLRERTQLHRLLVHELWIFGEEYTLDSDDEPWKAYLQKHIQKLDRSEVAPEVDIASINGIERIPDLLLSRRFVRHPKQFENLVIELKRPSIKIGSKEIVQIEEYANLVRNEAVFNKKDYQWTFVLIGNEIDTYAETRTSAKGMPPGCISRSDNLEIWVRRWSEIFTEAKFRYEFFRQRLEMEASGARGLAYLDENYKHLLTGKGMTKKQEAARERIKELKPLKCGDSVLASNDSMASDVTSTKSAKLRS